MNELALKAANDTAMTYEDRAYVQGEIDNMKSEITRVASATQLREQQLPGASAQAPRSQNISPSRIAVDKGGSLNMGVGELTAAALEVSDVVIADRESASDAIIKISNATQRVSKQQSALDSYQNSLGRAMDYLSTASRNTILAEGRIRDAKTAQEVMTQAKLQIMSHAGNAIFAQTDKLPQGILSMLL
jgi:flagellin